MLTYADICGGRSIHSDMTDLAVPAWAVDPQDFVRQVTYAHVCSRMLTYAHVCSRMLTYKEFVRQHLTYAHVCSRMLTYADVA